MTPDDRLTSELRAQASAFNPEAPPAVRRRILSALAEADVAPRSSRDSWTGWSTILTGLTAVAAIVVIVVAVRSRPTSNTIAQHPAPNRPHPAVLAHTSVAVADPMSLAHQYFDRPLETEVEHVLAGLTQTRDTVTRILPAPVRRARPATQPPAIGA
jgi:hypothetical protein